MFESLSTRLQDVFKSLRGESRLTPENVEVALRSLSPSQQVVKIVRDEMVALFGNAEGGLQQTTKRPRVILLLGLQGAGKTTTAGKLGMWLRKQGRHPLLVSTDVKRPAAIQQLN